MSIPLRTPQGLPMIWRWRQGEATLDRPRIMGILNVTPDSFADGGEHASTPRAVEHGLAMLAQGADILDIGGESTRPGADPVPADEEIRRVVPVIRTLRRFASCPLSVDTSKASVAAAALDAGADIINDISALSDPGMPRLIAESGAGLVLMHSRGTPRTMSHENRYAHLVTDIVQELRECVDLALHHGIHPSRICLDPGFGFAKVGMQNYELLRGFDSLAALGYPLLVGASRKSFIGQAISTPWQVDPNTTPTPYRPPPERLHGSLAFAVAAVLRGVHVVRVHDVKETCDAIRVAIHCS